MKNNEIHMNDIMKNINLTADTDEKIYITTTTTTTTTTTHNYSLRSGKKFDEIDTHKKINK